MVVQTEKVMEKIIMTSNKLKSVSKKYIGEPIVRPLPEHTEAKD